MIYPAKSLVNRLKLYYVYILTNTHNTVLYTGVTNDLERRCYEHKQKLVKGFSQKYNVDKLVYFEKFDLIDLAIFREKQIKKYSRNKKNTLITNFNKEWQELYQNERVKEPNWADDFLKGSTNPKNNSLLILNTVVIKIDVQNCM